jgi:hypothetical protein
VFSLFFIRRPIVACVIAILIVIAGAVAFRTLPVAQYPDIAPPIIRVTTVYPGASAQVVADTVAAPIEQQVNGVDRMIYMESTSASDAWYTLNVSFDAPKTSTSHPCSSEPRRDRVPQPPDEVRCGASRPTRSHQHRVRRRPPHRSGEDARVHGSYLANASMRTTASSASAAQHNADSTGQGHGMRICLIRQAEARGLSASTCQRFASRNVQASQPPAPADRPSIVTTRRSPHDPSSLRT